MKTVQLIQGTREWLSHRAAHWNASDAPAMLGVSPYKTRDQLLRELATGITADVDATTQRRFDDGHRFEELARPLAEKIVGEDLYPCVGVDGRFSASFDGLTIDDGTAFEHKTLGENLRSLMDNADFTGADLPEHYRVQMEQQCLVAGASRVLFMATRWEGETLAEQLWCWYTPDPELRARIVAGWEQFEKDLASYSHVEKQERQVTGRTPETLPALRIEARGMVTSSNLAEYKAHALAVLGNINRDLQTDDDFADAEATVKWCKGVEDRLEATKSSVLGQMADVDAVCRTLDDVAAETRRIRLELDKLVKAEKESRKAEIVRAGVVAVQKHYAEINTTMGEHAISLPPSLNFEIANTIKGLKTLSSIREKISTAVASAKIDASERAERVRKNVATLAEFADYGHLFADRIALCATKAPDDLRNLASMRVAEHKQREAHREKLRAEEAERIERERKQQEEQRIREAEERGRQMAEIAAQRQAEQVVQPQPEVEQVGAAPEPVSVAGSVAEVPNGFRYTPVRPPVRLKLGDINAAIAPLSITADGLARLGFHPVATDRASKLYEAATFEQIRAALLKVLTSARAEASTAAAA